jgi:putative pyruvate formate lyase activating enzyme
MSVCKLCPRECSVERDAVGVSFCGESDKITVSRATLHAFEEPSVSGIRGSGTIFFCGCNLRCVFCQNKIISRGGGVRHTLTPEELASLMLKLQAAGAHNINLVTPTHFSESIRRALIIAREELTIPVIYNSSGYEKVETLRSLDGLIDVYMPDFKYASSELALKYSSAPD